jgi:hypothetical protein
MGSRKFKNQEIYMYHLVNVDHKGTASHLSRSTVNGFKKHYISSAVDGTDRICCRVAVRGVSVKKMKALTVKMETETLIGKGK